jgi:hypothetical protein
MSSGTNEKRDSEKNLVKYYNEEIYLIATTEEFYPDIFLINVYKTFIDPKTGFLDKHDLPIHPQFHVSFECDGKKKDVFLKDFKEYKEIIFEGYNVLDDRVPFNYD